MVNPVLGLATFSITAISEATKNALAHYEWFSRQSIQVIYNGIQAKNSLPDNQSNELGLNNNHLVFGTITRFDTIKNLPMMVNAFSAIYKNNASARLLLVGDGEERAQTEALVSHLQIQEAVIFTGFQTDTKKYMDLIDVYVLSSFSEGTSMTLLEAMSAQLADAMRSLADNQHLRQQLGAAAKRTFDEKFDLRQMLDQFKHLYLSAR